MLRTLALSELVACWTLWVMAFVQSRKAQQSEEVVVRALASEWGVAMVIVSFGFVGMYLRPPGFAKSDLSLIVSMLLGPPSVLLVWTAARQLGRRWSYDALIHDDHRLIETGPYRWVRHPIYASSFGMLLATGTAWAWWPMFSAGILVFVVGAEVRVRAEERLLAERFGEVFSRYRDRTYTFLPFVW